MTPPTSLSLKPLAVFSWRGGRSCRAKLADDSLDMEIDVHFPTMFIEGDFKMEGKIGNFPFSGRGPWNVSISKHTR